MHGCISALELSEYNAALNAYKEGKYQTSITYVEQALQKDNTEPEFYVLRAKANYKIGNKVLAMEDLNKSLELGNSFAAYHLRGKLYLENNELEKAKVDLRIAYELNPKSPDVLFDLGYLEFANGESQLALEYYKEASKYDSRNPKTYVNIGNLYAMMGESKIAIDNYSKALVLDTINGIAFYNRANEKMILNDIEGAIEDYEKSLEIDSVNISTLIMLAEAKLKVGDLDGALSNYNSIIKIDTTFAKAYFLRGVSQVSIEEYGNACKDFKRAGELGYFEAYEMIKKYCDKKYLQKKKKTKK
jgi:tetratricopeptide (TPR) repeat protein